MERELSQLLYGAGVVAAIAIPLSLIWWARKQRREKLEQLAAGLGGEAVTALMADAYVRLNTAAGEVKVKLMPGDENEPPYLELQQLQPLGFNLSIIKENALTRALERWGIEKELKIGDPLFDDQYRIKGSDPARVMSFLQEPGRREAIEYFFRNGFRLIAANPNGVFAQKPKYQNSDLEPALLQEHLEQLRRFAAQSSSY